MLYNLSMQNRYLAHYRRLFAVLDAFKEGDQSRQEALVELQRLIIDHTNIVGADFELLVAQARALKIEPVEEPGVRIGTVKFYTPKDDRNYGFITDDATKTDVFFHKDRGVVMGCTGGDDPTSTGPETTAPTKGSRVVYQRADGKRGPVAMWWTFESRYRQALLAIADRPLIRYRDIVLEITRWEGRNLDHLRQLYPTWLGAHNGWDPDRFVFERHNGQEWVKINDPR